MSQLSKISIFHFKNTSFEYNKLFVLLSRWPPFSPFSIELSYPKQICVKCTAMIDYDPLNSLSVYRGVETSSNETLSVYEWRICLEKNNVYDDRKFEMCSTKVKPKPFLLFVVVVFDFGSKICPSEI